MATRSSSIALRFPFGFVHSCTGLDLRDACGRASPQGGSNMSAQGNALGLRRAIPKSPEGALQTISSKRTVHQTQRRWRLKSLGVAPFQGSYVIVFQYPGRCPGLTCCCPFGANKDRTRATGANKDRTRATGANNDRTRGVDRTRGEDRSQPTCVEQRGRATDGTKS